MAYDVVVDGQCGSTGKGKIAGWLALHDEYHWSMSDWMPNAGHTFEGDDGHRVMVQQIPQSVVNPNMKLYISPGAAIDLDILWKEIHDNSLNPERLTINPRALIIQKKHKEYEAQGTLYISSTMKGCGAALADKVLRKPDVLLARDIPELKPFLGETVFPAPVGQESVAQKMMRGYGYGLVEGAQGFDLDIDFGVDFPHCTSRHLTPAAVISRCGLPVKDCRDIYAVIRTYPIRVGNNYDSSGKQVGYSGDYPSNEVSWEEIEKRSGAPAGSLRPKELTTVTKKVRRVFEFSWDRIQYASAIIAPTYWCLNFVNYLNYNDYGKTDFGGLSQETKDFVNRLYDETGIPVGLIGTGPRDSHIVDIRGKAANA